MSVKPLIVTKYNVTWNETYKAEVGNTRFVERGKREFRLRADAEAFVAELQLPETIEFSMFAGQENKIEDIAFEVVEYQF